VYGARGLLTVATRVSTLASFGDLGLIPQPTSSSANEESPHWSADGKTLYFDSTRGGNRDLYRVPRGHRIRYARRSSPSCNRRRSTPRP
jgi:Tol biopolymer transport system component